MTGTLKNLLDHVPVEALRDKPVAIVAMGASDHHYLGAERHLRDVLAFFGALVVPTASYLSSADFDDGVPGERAAAELDALIATTPRARAARSVRAARARAAVAARGALTATGAVVRALAAAMGEWMRLLRRAWRILPPPPRARR